MVLPEPIHPLSGHCSIIYNETLYVYSPDGFQSLPLSSGAQWEKLPMGASLTGAQCVKAVNSEDESGARLYIVGGTTSEADYPGLMHYTFATKKWDTVTPDVTVTKNRLNHGAAYLPASKSILVYSGSQEPGNLTPSDQTFTISTESPYRTQGYQGQGAPPVLKPMLMHWDQSNAVMIGGSATNKAVFLFDATEGWRNLGVSLVQGIQNQEQVQCTIVSGDDGSKVLETYNMGVTPNQVTRTALLKEGGAVADPGQTVGDKAKRQLLTIQQWPAYNGTLAPTVTRTGYSIAQAEDDTAVISGGSDKDIMCIFNQKANSWLNATALFADQQAAILSTPTSTVTLSSTLIPTSTASTAPSSSTGAATGVATEGTGVPASNKTRMLTVLAATLGAIFSIAAILILLLFFLKYKKNKNRKAQQTGYVEKDRLSFADRGAEFMSEAGGSVGQNYSASMNASHSSLAIINQVGKSHNRGVGSDASTQGLVMKKSPLGYSEPVELSKFDLKPEPVVLVRQNSNANANVRPPPSRSSGWSRYFANNEATNLAHMSAGQSTFVSERSSTDSQSMYNDSRVYSQPPPDIAPLEIPKFDGEHISRVPTGSPTLGNSRENLHVPMESMQAELARADSNASARSGVSRDDHYERAPVDSWTPMSHATAYDRPPSSNYGDHNNRDGASSYYPNAADSYYPKSGYSSFFASGQLDVPQFRESTATVFPGAQPQTSGANYDRDSGAILPLQPPLPLGVPQDRESTFTVFPGGAPVEPDKSQPDMSWLNLGTSQK
ncbi:hypothetical protein K504DRAFT_62890 [Pleomassaria siparia CBS 279.74]|uniref:Pre-mRNA splicing factor CLF1 n=1 Tax=Pleomassaria siparia CBS 279.74 TaxID=1314801 RepID=A0A6G1K2L4_9PLEO|nr:hypothetical protein K504DRAFT_62890 [Pleomassaria siparia CBS 279.74]